MRIAIFGATSQIAGDLILSLSIDSHNEMALFARNVEGATNWLNEVGLSDRHPVASYAGFRISDRFDALINFVGVGSPKLARAMGSSILEVTAEYDELALSYVRAHPNCRYLFLSSGASLGSIYEKPADALSNAIVPLADLHTQDFYGVAKLYAECRHRASSTLPIVDLRVFSYFSRTQDLDSEFFLADIVKAILTKSTVKVTSDFMTRDYLGPQDFHRLVDCILRAPPQNRALDCYTLAPIEKSDLLQLMHNHFGLRFETTSASLALIPTTARKAHYYSLSRVAAEFGYMPQLTSERLILQEVAKIVERVKS